VALSVVHRDLCACQLRATAWAPRFNRLAIIKGTAPVPGPLHTACCLQSTFRWRTPTGRTSPCPSSSSRATSAWNPTTTPPRVRLSVCLRCACCAAPLSAARPAACRRGEAALASGLPTCMAPTPPALPPAIPAAAVLDLGGHPHLLQLSSDSSLSFSRVDLQGGLWLHMVPQREAAH
jgi:hypothetical protein